MKNLKNNRSGYMIMEALMALAVLGFIVRPAFVERENESGGRTTKLEWELPISQFLGQLGNLRGLIDQSWAGLDRQFGYRGSPMGERAGTLMTESLQNAMALMTAGFVDRQGRFTGDFSNNAGNFEDAAKGMCTAYYNAAREGMRRN
jgi:hypothetical protein